MKTTETQKQNARILVKHLDQSGFPIPFQIGIMCVVGKESRFIPRAERSYRNTSNERLRKLFSRVRHLSEHELTTLKTFDSAFFRLVYGGKLGNRPGTDDAWDYRGAGLNQITGRTMHRRYNTSAEKLKKPEEAARVCVEYFADRVGSPRIAERYDNLGMWTGQTGILIACNVNAGLGYGRNHTVVQRAYKHALKWYDFCLGVFWESEGGE